MACNLSTAVQATQSQGNSLGKSAEITHAGTQKKSLHVHPVSEILSALLKG